MVNGDVFEAMHRRRVEQRGRGWIGFDLDGTLAFYDEWRGWNDIGPPVMPMIYRVRRFLGEGHDCRILTARIGPHLGYVERPFNYFYSAAKLNTCLVTGERWSDADMCEAVQAWCEEHVGARMPVTCVKDVGMIELWDDRAIQVESNTGRTVFDAFEAEYHALGGKP